MKPILEASGPVIYVAMALAALYGVFCVVLLWRKISQKRFSSPAAAGAFLDEVRENLDAKNFDAVAEVCDSPPYWSKATPQMILVALAHRDRGLSKLQTLLAEKYERDILADLQYRHSWIGTISKTAPMLGLLGTVSGMILAFEKIGSASAQGGLDPSSLASEISFALFTTAIGLIVAIPLTLLGAWVQVKMSKMTDGVQDQLGEFLHDLERAMTR
ncbi:MAG: MotA/TolQ/ExbB proton channel family protein [Planctomycetaceae bacterium]|nr:MotA/TolQ/ExbB proton channel family protein [Planctomycetaceae bacterium]